MSIIYIIDGYNVMHAQEHDGIEAGDLSKKREAFIEDVINYIATTGGEAVVVFDAARARRHECHEVPGTPVTVCYASATESADILIGKLVRQRLSGGSEKVKVVSADWEVQRGAMQERVERIPPRNFLEKMKNFTKKLANSSKMDRIRWKLEHKVDVETLRKLEEMRKGESD